MLEESKETSTYYDFSQKPVQEWQNQARKYADVEYYYDDEQKCYCRKINNVPGKLIEVENPEPNLGKSRGYFKYEFIPDHPLVSYKQYFTEKEDFYA